MDDLKKMVRDVPDFPKPGILFKDITPLLQNPQGLKKVIDIFTDHYSTRKIDKVVGIESRGFIFGAALSLQLGIGFVPVRKAGKLPWTKVSQEYVLEYGTDKLEMHADALSPNEQILIIDDLLATGGTVGAVTSMVEKQRAKVVSLAFVVELDFLKGRQRLRDRDVFSILHY